MESKINLTNILILALIIIGMYYLKVRVIVSLVDGTKSTWNGFVELITSFRYRYPIAFISLPILYVWVLSRK